MQVGILHKNSDAISRSWLGRPTGWGIHRLWIVWITTQAQPGSVAWRFVRLLVMRGRIVDLKSLAPTPATRTILENEIPFRGPSGLAG